MVIRSIIPPADCSVTPHQSGSGELLIGQVGRMADGEESQRSIGGQCAIPACDFLLTDQCEGSQPMPFTVNVTKRERSRKLKSGERVSHTRWVVNYKEPRSGQRRQLFFEKADAHAKRNELLASPPWRRAGPVQWVALPGVFEQGSASTFATVSDGNGALPDSDRFASRAAVASAGLGAYPGLNGVTAPAGFGHAGECVFLCFVIPRAQARRRTPSCSSPSVALCLSCTAAIRPSVSDHPGLCLDCLVLRRAKRCDTPLKLLGGGHVALPIALPVGSGADHGHRAAAMSRDDRGRIVERARRPRSKSASIFSRSKNAARPWPASTAKR
jgi:hypothetical protein